MLRVADHLPANHFLVEPLVKYWMNLVTERSGGAVTFEYYPAEQLGKARDMLTLALTGVTDIAGIVPSYISEKLPLSVVAELPGSFDTACRGTLAYAPLLEDGGALVRNEYALLGFRPLFSIVLPPYQVFARQRIDSVEAFAGLKLSAPGGAKEIMVRKIKAVPIRMPAPELHESLARGTVDGGLLGTGSILSYGLVGSAKFVTRGENFGSVVAVWGIAETRWKRLPEPVRKLMIETGSVATRHMCAVADRSADADYEKMMRGGTTPVTLPAADHDKLAAMAAAVRAEWKDALDKRGKPATEVLKAYTDELARRSGGSPR